MNLSTQYLGLSLPHPFIPGASPLADEMASVRRLEDAGAAAIVMRSLFEEQISQEQMAMHQYTDFHRECFAEAATFFPEPESFRLGPEAYLEQLRRIKDAVDVPVIASLNGTTVAGWIEHARLIEQAGADALELNVYHVGGSPTVSALDLENRTIELVRAIKRRVHIPVSVKLSPYYSSLSHFAAQLDAAGADGLVLFNRLFQPEIDIEALEVRRALKLSNNSELPLRLRWLGILSAQIRGALAVSGGVHSAEDAVRAVMTGAHAVQLVSALLTSGPEYLAQILNDFRQWMDEHQYSSLDQLRGILNLRGCPDPGAYERANYMMTLQTWRPFANWGELSTAPDEWTNSISRGIQSK
jgi:dihydroorotate dehydrogenase (fumarate)